MTLEKRLLYGIPGGDRWHLVREGGRVFVKHQPNLASGGLTSHIEIADFLARGHGPECQELLRLIGTLVEGYSDT